MGKIKDGELSFEEAFRRLEALVEILERGDSTLDESMKAFEEGMKMAETCSKKLSEAEARLQKLVKGEEGGFRVEPMQ